MQTQKAKHQIMSNFSLTQLSLVRDNKISRATITDFCGIDKEIVDSAEANIDAMEVPTFEKDCQVNFGRPEVVVQIAQTDLHMGDIIHMENRNEELEAKNFQLEKQVSHLHDLHTEQELNYQESLKKIQKQGKDKNDKKTDKDATIFITKCKNDELDETSSKNSINHFENKIIQSRKLSSTRDKIEFSNTAEVKEISQNSPIVTIKPKRDIIEFNKSQLSRSKYPDYSKIK